MSMILCKECGKEFSDMADKCPNCGCPTEYSKKQHQKTEGSVEEKTELSDKQKEKEEKKKEKTESALGIVALILSIFGFTAFIGLICGLIDLAKNDQEKKHSCSKFALIIVAIWFLMLVFMSACSTSETEQNQTQTTVEESAEYSNSDSKYIKVGESFEVDGLKITINEANTDYTDYSNEYVEHDAGDGKKFIMASFTYENNGDSDKLSGIYDYDCYADGTLCEQYFYFDDSSFMEANLSSGRNVSFKVWFIVPEDAKNIELEYTENVWTDDKIFIKL